MTRSGGLGLVPAPSSAPSAFALAATTLDLAGDGSGMTSIRLVKRVASCLARCFRSPKIRTSCRAGSVAWQGEANGAARRLLQTSRRRIGHALYREIDVHARLCRCRGQRAEGGDSPRNYWLKAGAEVKMRSGESFCALRPARRKRAEYLGTLACPVGTCPVGTVKSSSRQAATPCSGHNVIDCFALLCFASPVQQQTALDGRRRGPIAAMVRPAASHRHHGAHGMEMEQHRHVKFELDYLSEIRVAPFVRLAPDHNRLNLHYTGSRACTTAKNQSLERTKPYPLLQTLLRAPCCVAWQDDPMPFVMTIKTPKLPLPSPSHFCKPDAAMLNSTRRREKKTAHSNSIAPKCYSRAADRKTSYITTLNKTAADQRSKLTLAFSSTQMGSWGLAREACAHREEASAEV